MKRTLIAIVLLVAALLVVSTDQSSWARAPHGPYRGPRPAPGAITAFDTVRYRATDETKAGAPPFLLPRTTNRSQHNLGTLELHPDADSVIVVVYGDNRPGFRLMTTPWGLPAVLGIGSRDFTQFLWGLVNVPVFLVQCIVPSLDFFRDAYATFWSHRYTGGREDEVLQAVLNEVKRDPRISFVVQTGDVVENGRRGGLYETFVEKHAELRTTVPYLATVGNHERTFDHVGRENWEAVMGPPASPERYWYAVDFPDSIARFVFIDTNILADPKNHYPDTLEQKMADEQIAWIDSALAVPARYRFIVQHHPLVTSGHYLSDWQYDDSKPEEIRRRAKLLEIFRRRRVTAVLAGHEHLYQRTFIRGKDGKGFWHIATGGGGSPLYRISKRERLAALAVVLPDSSRVTWNRARSMYHYSRLTIQRRPRHGEERCVLDVFRVRSSGKVYSIDHVDLSQWPPE